MDRDLVTKAQRGDRDAFAVLARSSGDQMFAVAHRILRDFHRAEDAVQQTLVIAWRELPMLRDPDRWEPWLRRLLVRVCYVEAGRARRWSANIRALPVGEDPGGGDESLSLDDRDQLDRGFRRMPPEQRVILVMHHYLGLSAAEIGEELEIPAGTARSRLHYAHRAMRAALEADERRVAMGGRAR